MCHLVLYVSTLYMYRLIILADCQKMQWLQSAYSCSEYKKEAFRIIT
jgi:hypothetical protein